MLCGVVAAGSSARNAGMLLTTLAKIAPLAVSNTGPLSVEFKMDENPPAMTSLWECRKNATSESPETKTRELHGMSVQVTKPRLGLLLPNIMSK